VNVRLADALLSLARLAGIEQRSKVRRKFIAQTVKRIRTGKG
jgi:hypothetical protein